jgi:hypothetical protein
MKSATCHPERKHPGLKACVTLAGRTPATQKTRCLNGSGCVSGRTIIARKC